MARNLDEICMWHNALVSPALLDAPIVILDDEHANVALLERLLRAVGYNACRGMTDPVEAVLALHENPPDLLLLDWHMSPFSGCDVLRELKKLPTGECPLVLVMTADTSHSTRCEALAAGATDFLAKPLDSCEVLLRTRNLLQLRRTHLALEQQVYLRTLELEQAVTELKEVQFQLLQQQRLSASGYGSAGAGWPPVLTDHPSL